MNTYRVYVKRFFNGYESFIISADTKELAKKAIQERLIKSGNGNYDIDDIKVEKMNVKK